MSRHYWRLLAILLVVALVGSFGLTQSADAKSKAREVVSGQTKSQPPGGASKPYVVRSVKNDRSIPLRDMKPLPAGRGENEKREIPNRTMPKALVGASRTSTPGNIANAQNFMLPNAMPATFQNFDTLPNNCNCAPPDPNGAVGPNNYVSIANSQYQVYDKSGNSLLGPLDINTLWSGFGGDCQNTNNGDPIVLYDHLADRWLISQFAITIAGASANSQCVAVSTSGDPTGSYNRYQFFIPGNLINDYPKFGVWPDGYYMTANQFDPNTFGWAGAGVFAFERDQMILGNPAQMVYFDLFTANNCFGGMLPGDLDGPAPPPGTPNVFAEWDDDTFSCGPATDHFSLWNFHVDWTTPSNSTFGDASHQPNVIIQDSMPIDSNMCNYSRACIPQAGTSNKVDAISDRLMYRLQYRYFGGYSTLVGNHTVDADGTDHAGVNWFEIRDSGAGWQLNQEGIYAPDSNHRWMGSAAMDSAGNMAIGFSISSTAIFPSIHYAGRLSGDPAGQMSQGEGTIIDGTHFEANGANRWGDYTGLVMDPTPGSAGGIDCDFWYTNEYLTGNGWSDWQVHAGAFTFAPAACGGPHGTLEGTVTDSVTTNPIPGATVTVSPGGFTTTTDAAGHYLFVLAVGTYDVSASFYGYFTNTVTGQAVTDGGDTIADIQLTPAPVVTVSGTVADGGGHGYGLYARIDIAPYPFGPIFTNPLTGAYSVSLVQDQPYTFNVQAILPGYTPESRPVTPPAGGTTEDFDLLPTAACTTPGYTLGDVGLITNPGFETGDFTGWTIDGNSNTPVVTSAQAHSGTYSAEVGNDSGGEPLGDSSFYQQFTVPPTGGTLTFWAMKFTTDSISFDWQDAYITDSSGNILQTIFHTCESSGWTHWAVDLAPYAGQTVRIKFLAHQDGFGDDTAMWVDDVSVGACGPITGGLVVGNTYDLNTGLGLNGVTVTSDGAPSDTTTSIATPADPAVDDGLYMLFSTLTDLQSFTASKNKYSSDTESVTVNPDEVASLNFNLGAGFLVLTPNPLEQTVDLGTTVTVPLNIDNTGTGSADWQLGEGNGHTNAPIHTGGKTPVKLINGHFTPWRFGFTPAKGMPAREAGEGKDQPSKHVFGPQDAPWTNIAGYPSPIMDNTCAEINGLIYCVGGYDGGSILSSGHVYDPGSDSWASIASMSVTREKPAVAAINGLLYVVGGWDSNGNPSPVLEIYDPGTDSWTTGASEPTAYAASTAVNLNGVMYVIGGCTSGCGVTTVQAYDPGSDSWTSAASYPENISWVACAAIGGQIYCGGGVSDAGESQHTYVYDPGADAWTQLANMPQTQWAMGYTGSDNLLYISGGVTNNFSTVTNQGFYYDPSADSWTAIENSNNTVYRGGSACGFYRVGGSIGGFSPVPNSEVYPGLTNCGGVVDVPWLSENPTSGTLAGGANTNVDVTFDATVVNQPGDYLAHLKVTNTTPYSVPDVQVTMHVPLPPGWGWLTGTVTSLLRCDAPGSALKNATVFVDTAGTDFTLKTDATGHYQVAFLASDGPATVTVSKTTFVTQVIPGVTITPGNTTTLDVALRLDAPCVVGTPDPLEATVDLGTQTTLPFNLDNSGAGSADWKITEAAGHSAFHLKSAHRVLSGKPSSSKHSGAKATPSPTANTITGKGHPLFKTPAFHRYPNAAGDVIQTWAPSAFSWGIAIDPSSENVWVDSPGPGWGGSDNNFEFLPDGTPTGVQWPHTWGPAYGPADSTQNPNTGMIWTLGVGVPDNCIHEMDPTAGYTGNTICPAFSISQRGVAYDPSTDTYFAGSWNDGMIHHFDATGAFLDETFVGLSISGLAYNPDTLHLFVMVNDVNNTIHVLDAANGYVDLGSFAVNGFGAFAGAGLEMGCDGSLWAVNQGSNMVYQIDSGESTSMCGQDLPWLSENPDSGTLSPGTNTNVDVTFDASAVNQPGDYLAHFKIKPSGTPDVQVTMHVPLPPGWGWLTGTVTGLGRCDAAGSPLKGATVFIDTAGTDYTMTTDTNGYYQVAFLASDGPATVTVSAPGYVLQTLPGVGITAGGTTTSDFALRLDAPCADKAPGSFDVTLHAGQTSTLPLTLANTGAGSLGYQIKETTFPLPPLIRKPFPARKAAPVLPKGIGPKSIRTLAPKGAAEIAAKRPDSGWFMALPVPGGLVRYAHAQCDIQPNSYYVISGVDGTFSTTKKAWRYDADTNTWNALADMPDAVEGPTATCAFGKLYVMGGSNNGATGSTDMFIYDIGSNTWSSGAALPRGVWGAAAGAWLGTVYLIGGDQDFFGSGTSNEVDVYDIASDTWIGTGSSMPFAAATPGFIQTGPFVYVVGGWDDSTSPGSNVSATQRYDMQSDTWSTGPDFTSARADLALSATDTALYAMGGDSNGGGFFDASNTVERLDYTTWPAGAWADIGDPMPVKETANNAGYCTEAFHIGGSASEVYSLGGIDQNFVSAGNNQFHGQGTEHCFSIFSDVSWLSESPASGTVGHDSSLPVNVTFDSTGLAAGDYTATLVVATNDSGAPQFDIPVTLHVLPCLFCDEFSDSVLDWTYTGAWTESSSLLKTVAGSKKSTALASNLFSGCQNCSIESNVSIVGTSTSRVWLYGWWVDKKNDVELLIKEANNKIILKQRTGGSIVKKQSVPVNINPSTPYTITMTNNGATIVVNVDGTDVLTFTPIGTVPSGTVGYGVKNATGSFDWIHVN